MYSVCCSKVKKSNKKMRNKVKVIVSQCIAEKSVISRDNNSKHTAATYALFINVTVLCTHIHTYICLSQYLPLIAAYENVKRKVTPNCGLYKFYKLMRPAFARQLHTCCC